MKKANLELIAIEFLGRFSLELNSIMPELTKPLLRKLAEGLKTWFTRPTEPKPYKLDISILEDRILYSATAMPMPDAAPMDFSSLNIDDIQSALQAAVNEPLDITALQAAFEDKSLMAAVSLNVGEIPSVVSTEATTDNDSQLSVCASLDSTFDDVHQMLGDLQSPSLEQLSLTVPAWDNCSTLKRSIMPCLNRQRPKALTPEA